MTTCHVVPGEVEFWMLPWTLKMLRVSAFSNVGRSGSMSIQVDSELVDRGQKGFLELNKLGLCLLKKTRTVGHEVTAPKQRGSAVQALIYRSGCGRYVVQSIRHVQQRMQYCFVTTPNAVYWKSWATVLYSTALNLPNSAWPRINEHAANSLLASHTQDISGPRRLRTERYLVSVSGLCPRFRRQAMLR